MWQEIARRMLLKNIMRRKLRTFLSLLAVALSIGTTIALLGVSTGLVEQVSRIVSTAGAELTVVEKSPKHLTFGYLGAMPGNVIDALRSMPEVAWASPVLLIPLTISKDAIFLLYGVDPSGPDTAKIPIVGGRRLGPSDGPAIVLGRRAAESMNKKPGDSITVFTRDVPVVGIYESGINLEDSGAMINLTAAWDKFGLQGQVSFVKVKAADPRKVRALQRAIDDRWPTISAITSEEFAQNRLSLEASIQASWAVSIIALVLSTLAIANTMAVAVLTRTREIGVLLAVGWSRGRIAGLFLGEAIVPSFGGGLLGILFGTVALGALNETHKMLPLPSSVTPATLLEVMGLSLLVGLVGGLLPAWHASKLDPVHSLRLE